MWSCCRSNSFRGVTNDSMLNRPGFCGDSADWILRGNGCLALTMVDEAVDLAELVPLRGVAGDVHGRRPATRLMRVDAGQLTPEPSRWRCKGQSHVRPPGPSPTGARTRLAAGSQRRCGVDAGSTSPPTQRWPARPAPASARARGDG